MDIVWTVTIFIIVPGFLVFFGLKRSHRRSTQRRAPGSRPGFKTTLFGSFVLGIMIWFLWLSWGDYYTDPFGNIQGPYRPWQVVSCALTMVVSTLIMGLWTRWPRTGPFAAAAGLVFGFSAAWGIDAFSQDSSGLAGVGMLFLLCGAGVGLGITAGILVGLREFAYSRKA